LRIIIGTANFGSSYGVLSSQLDKSNIYKIKLLLKKNKINYFDTAFEYKGSNQLINFLKTNNSKIIQKFKIPDNYNKNNCKLTPKILKTLKDYNSSNLDSLLFHNINDFKSKEIKNVLEELYQLKKKKIIKKIGVSIYSPNDLKQIFKHFVPEVIQAPINIFDNRILKSKWMKLIKKHKISLHARSIFLQGLALRKFNEIQKIKALNKKSLKHLKNYESYLNKSCQKKIDYCLNFVLNIEKVDSIVIGIKNANELREILEKIKKKKIKKNILNQKKFFTNNLNLIDPREWKNE